LRGHNSESVAHQLGISWNTARRHRTRAYAKLGVSSQGELFYAFLRTLGLEPDES
jgi:DNA-binding CsgD family transcriptional regulator